MDNSKEKALREWRFECQHCGTCCSEMAVIYPGSEEVQKLAKYLNISVLSFAVRYLREIHDPQNNMYILAFRTNHPGNTGHGCVFYRDKSCVIYNSPRTDLCKVFPWNHFDLETKQWEENFISRDGKFWCAGIGIGRKWTLDEIRDVKQRYPCVGINIKRQLNQPTLPIVDIDMISDSSIFNLTISEENFINKLRSLPMEKKREVERLVDSLYHL